MNKIMNIYRTFISGSWFVAIMRQVVVTGGNIAESAFLLATLWVVVNAVAHTLLTWFMPIRLIELFNYLSVIAFSALPELLIIPVSIICLSHWSLTMKRKDSIAATWAVLYSVPAVFFLVMTILALTTFVSTGGAHAVPANGLQLVIRCLSGWMFAVVNMLFHELGKPHYASQMEALNQKNCDISAQFREEKMTLENEIETLSDQLRNERESFRIEREAFRTQIETLSDQFRNELSERENQLNSLFERFESMSEAASRAELEGVSNLPKMVLEWIEKDLKTVRIEDIVIATGITKRRIINAKLRRHNRNPDFIFVSSLVEWLKSLPSSNETCSKSVPVSDQSLSNGHQTDTEELEMVPFRVS